MARQTYEHEGRWHVVVREDDPPSVREVIARLEADVAEGTRMPPGPKALEAMLDSARRDGGKPTAAMMRRIQALANQCALSRDDRIELAEVLLRRDITSWNDLSNAEAHTLAAGMEGFAYICHLQAREGKRWREERVAKSAAAGRNQR